MILNPNGVLQWVEESRNYKYERGEYEIPLSIDILKGFDPINDIDE